MRLPPEIGDEIAELQRRLAARAGGSRSSRPSATVPPRRSRITGRAGAPACFSPWTCRSPHATRPRSPRGDYLAVIGDVHPGANPLMQGVFAHRHPDPPRMLRAGRAAIGRGVPLLLPPYGPGLGVDARHRAVTAEHDVHIAAMPDTRAPQPRRTWLPHELLDRRRPTSSIAPVELRVPLVDAFGMAIFVAAVRTFELLPDERACAARDDRPRRRAP